MTRIWHDWEFLEDGQRIFPISVGMYRESDGATLYRVFSDVDPAQIQQHYWLRLNVWPKLNLEGDGPIDFSEEYVKSRAAIKHDVAEFIREAYIAGGVELWADYGAYDHVSLAQLWGPMVALPPYIPMWTNDLRTEIARRELDDIRLPLQRSSRVHNALADAQHEALVMWFLGAYDLLDNQPDRQRLISDAREGRWPTTADWFHWKRGIIRRPYNFEE